MQVHMKVGGSFQSVILASTSGRLLSQQNLASSRRKRCLYPHNLTGVLQNSKSDLQWRRVDKIVNKLDMVTPINT